MLNSKTLKYLLKYNPDLIVPEVEALDTSCLENAEKNGFNVIPQQGQLP